MFGLSEFSMQ